MSKTNNDIFVMLGASNHSKSQRADNDYYTTDPIALELLLDEFKLSSSEVWEPACGSGNLSEVLKKRGYSVKSTDLIDRGYGESGVDFLLHSEKFDGDIVTNPPYSIAKEFCEKAIDVVSDGRYVAMFLRLNFLETKSRRELFDKYPPKYVYVSSKRINCYRNGDDSPEAKKDGGAVAYAWFIWQKGYKGDTVIRWFN